MPESLPEDIELEDNSVDEEGEAQCGPSLGTNECHEITETHQHHDINILEPRVVADQVIAGHSGVIADEEAVQEEYGHFNHEQQNGKAQQLVIVLRH